MKCGWSPGCRHQATVLAVIRLISPAVGNNGHGPAGRPLAMEEAVVRVPVCAMHRKSLEKFYRLPAGAASEGVAGN